MPTGYTSDVFDGKVTELAPFAMRLARGMGTLASMRDEPLDAPIPDRFEPHDYNAKQLENARDRHVKLLAMTNDECQNAADNEFQKIIADEKTFFQDNSVARERYKSMIKKLEAWQGAPAGIKEYGLSQLRDSMDFDCPENQKYHKKAVLRTSEEWRADQIEKCKQDLAYHASEHEKEIARANERTAWVTQLLKSLSVDGKV